MWHTLLPIHVSLYDRNSSWDVTTKKTGTQLFSCNVNEATATTFKRGTLSLEYGLKLLTKAFGEVCLLVNEDFGGGDGTKWLECLAEVGVGELLG